MRDMAGMRRLLEEATLRTDEVAEPHVKAPLLARISSLRQDDDPERAAHEAADAVALADSLEDPYARSFALAEVSQGLASAHPLKAASAARAALRHAKTVVDLHARTIALAEVASAFGAVDRERAKRVLAEAELLAETACSRRRCLHPAVFERMARLDPEEALRKADHIRNPGTRGVVLAHAIPRLAATDPRRAMALVERVPELGEKITTWADLCEALADARPELAIRAAENAEGNAAFSHNAIGQLNTLASVARSVHRIDPGRAKALLAAAEAVFERLEPSHARALAVIELARAQARFDAERGASTARKITYPHCRAQAFVLLAEDMKTMILDI